MLLANDFSNLLRLLKKTSDKQNWGKLPLQIVLIKISSIHNKLELCTWLPSICLLVLTETEFEGTNKKIRENGQSEYRQWKCPLARWDSIIECPMEV